MIGQKELQAAFLGDHPVQGSLHLNVVACVVWWNRKSGVESGTTAWRVFPCCVIGGPW
jgi:hypothetical protein